MDKNLNKMTKAQLEEYGRTLGIELDKRLKKSALVSQIEEFLEAPQTIESIETRPDRVHAVDIADASDQVSEFLKLLPAYDGNNSSEIGSAVFKNLSHIAGHKLQWGEVNGGYQIVIDGDAYDL